MKLASQVTIGNVTKREKDIHDDDTIDGLFSYLYTYDSAGKIIRETWIDEDPDGATYYFYNSNGNNIRVESDQDFDGEIDSVATNAFNSNGDQISWEWEYFGKRGFFCTAAFFMMMTRIS